MSRFIGQLLADHPCQKLVSPLGIVYALGDPVIIPEIKLGKVSVKVLFFAVVIDAIDSPLEDAEIPFDGIGGYDGALLDTDVLFLLVIHFGVLADRSSCPELLEVSVIR